MVCVWRLQGTRRRFLEYASVDLCGGRWKFSPVAQNTVQPLLKFVAQSPSWFSVDRKGSLAIDFWLETCNMYASKFSRNSSELLNKIVCLLSLFHFFNFHPIIFLLWQNIDILVSSGCHFFFFGLLFGFRVLYIEDSNSNFGTLLHFFVTNKLIWFLEIKGLPLLIRGECQINNSHIKVL